MLIALSYQSTPVSPDIAVQVLCLRLKSLSPKADTHRAIGNRLFKRTSDFLAFSLSLPGDIMIFFLSISAYNYYSLTDQIEREESLCMTVALAVAR